MTAQSTFLTPERQFGFALHDVARLLRTYVDKRSREIGMNRAQWAVMARLQRRQGSKQSELALDLDLQPISLTRLVDKLCAQGLVERRPDASDRRVNRLFLTAKAAPLMSELGALGENLMARVVEGIEPDALATINRQLELVRANLKAELNVKG